MTLGKFTSEEPIASYFSVVRCLLQCANQILTGDQPFRLASADPDDSLAGASERSVNAWVDT